MSQASMELCRMVTAKDGQDAAMIDGHRDVLVLSGHRGAVLDRVSGRDRDWPPA